MPAPTISKPLTSARPSSRNESGPVTHEGAALCQDAAAAFCGYTESPVAVRLTRLSWLSFALGAAIILLMIVSDGGRVGVTFIYLPRADALDTKLLGLQAVAGRFELFRRTSPLSFDR